MWIEKQNKMPGEKQNKMLETQNRMIEKQNKVIDKQNKKWIACVGKYANQQFALRPGRKGCSILMASDCQRAED